MTKKDSPKTDKEIEELLIASFGNQLAIGSIKEHPKLIDINMVKQKPDL